MEKTREDKKRQVKRKQRSRQRQDKARQKQVNDRTKTRQEDKDMNDVIEKALDLQFGNVAVVTPNDKCAVIDDAHSRGRHR